MPGHMKIDAHTTEWISMAVQSSFNEATTLGSTHSKIFLQAVRSFRANAICGPVISCTC